MNARPVQVAFPFYYAIGEERANQILASTFDVQSRDRISSNDPDAVVFEDDSVTVPFVWDMEGVPDILREVIFSPDALRHPEIVFFHCNASDYVDATNFPFDTLVDGHLRRQTPETFQPLDVGDTARLFVAECGPSCDRRFLPYVDFVSGDPDSLDMYGEVAPFIRRLRHGECIPLDYDRMLLRAVDVPRESVDTFHDIHEMCFHLLMDRSFACVDAIDFSPDYLLPVTMPPLVCPVASTESCARTRVCAAIRDRFSGYIGGHFITVDQMLPDFFQRYPQYIAEVPPPSGGNARIAGTIAVRTFDIRVRCAEHLRSALKLYAEHSETSDYSFYCGDDLIEIKL